MHMHYKVWQYGTGFPLLTVAAKAWQANLGYANSDTDNKEKQQMKQVIDLNKNE